MPEGRADAKLRAGFMLMPESGDSKVMNDETRQPATQGVIRAQRREFATRRTIETSRKEIVNSAASAIHGPLGPGTVATYFASATREPRSALDKTTPAVP